MKIGQAIIKDIATELNVSASTVSRALKDYPGISDETKRKVKEVANKLNQTKCHCTFTAKKPLFYYWADYSGGCPFFLFNSNQRNRGSCFLKRLQCDPNSNQ